MRDGEARDVNSRRYVRQCEPVAGQVAPDHQSRFKRPAETQLSIPNVENVAKGPSTSVDASRSRSMSGRVPEEEAELRELIRDYRKAVASKPARQQETYGLSRLYGLTYEESGDVTGVSVHAVRSQIAGALRLLRKRLAEHL